MKRIELKPRSILLAALTGFYAVMWLGGVVHYTLYGAPPLDAPWAASVFLLLAGLLVLLNTKLDDWPSLALAAALGFAAEVLGVRYGFIFSPYQYTDLLQPQLFKVPLVMLSAWLVLVAYVGEMLSGRAWPRWLIALTAAAWMTAIDLVIDPLAANQLAYWRWGQGGIYYGIPARNFLGWFIVSFIIFGLLPRGAQPNPWARHVGLSIVLFFTAIAFAYRLMLAGGIGLGLCLVHLALTYRRRA
jgi:bisanhydrobacterioruberin hydratase